MKQPPPTKDNMLDVISACDEQADDGVSNWPGMSYEQGVAAALRWVLGEAEHPLTDA